MKSAIAIVGMACRYPDACSPKELWENVLAQRRAFRRIPAERLRLDDYYHPDRSMPDRTYITQGAFITDYIFNRIQFRITGNAYRASDLVHWLALDIASQALRDAGFSLEEGNIPTDATGVLIGNTLTGEFSRANTLRLRWPYVCRVVEAALMQEGWSTEQCHLFLLNLEAAYKAPFAPVGEETLAGGLSNTIAGRICNYFDLHGGGYAVDGACASSLLAVYQTCSALVARDIDMGLAGGVDLSLDPFELIGFAKTAALAPDEMRVFDRRSAGFLPGEGCGFVVLMRYEDALAQQRHIYAVIRGWGMSSDGNGGITRPEVAGQRMALMRAYQRAGFGIDTVAYFEGHGTGTSVGDATELQALSQALANEHAPSPLSKAVGPTSAVIGSIKANIGHTKAAAGIAGLIKATMALATQIIPPTTGTIEPHHELTRPDAQLRVLDKGMLWPADTHLRAAVSAMGFGGINAHIVLEGESTERRTTLTDQEQLLLNSAQDAELFVFAAMRPEDMHQQIADLLMLVPRLSLAELGDVAAYLAKHLSAAPIKAALIANTPQELTQQLQKLSSVLESGVIAYWEQSEGIFLSIAQQAARIGFLFPGQGAPSHRRGGALRHHFPTVDALYTEAQLPQAGDDKSTEIAQVAIATASLAALDLFAALGITAQVAIGHSLGELCALHWAGAFDQQGLLRLVKERGRAMNAVQQPTGVMVSLSGSQQEVEPLLIGTNAVISGLNSPSQTTIAGTMLDGGKIIARARIQGIKAVRLPVSHAFHSPLMEAAISPFRQYLQQERFTALQFPVISTITGQPLSSSQDLKALLCQQITHPVLFMQAVSYAASLVDFWIEVGPGSILSRLVSDITSMPAIFTDAGSSSLRSFLQAVGAAFVMGVPVDLHVLFAQRFQRPFTLDWHPQFFANPCEQNISAPIAVGSVHEEQADGSASVAANSVEATIEVLRHLVASKAELPITAVFDQSRLLSDLHINSITVGQIITEACRKLALSPSSAPTDYADATVQSIAQALDQLKKMGHSAISLEAEKYPAGITHWVRPFVVELFEQPFSLVKEEKKAWSASLHASPAGHWQVLSTTYTPFMQELHQRLARMDGEGIVLCLAEKAYQEPDMARLLQVAQQVLAQKDPLHLLVLQHEEGIAGFVRCLYLEATQHVITIVTVPVGHPQTVEWIAYEISTHRQGYRESVYSAEGKRYQPRLMPLHLPVTSTPFPLNNTDVLLVTGGGKGIAAECAFSLARDTGVRLLLIGRSHPDTDIELAGNLRRLSALDIEYRYIMADVTDIRTLQPALHEAQQRVGVITALLHGAGTNIPCLLSELEEATIAHTLAPKVQGLSNLLRLLQALNTSSLRMLITFGSVIARVGMRGEADYALANDCMAALTGEYQAEHPHCRCLCLEWSVWSGVGMGERLGRVDALKSSGIMPIAPDEGIVLLQQLLAQPQLPTRIVVGGRFGELPTLQRQQSTPLFLRFLETIKVFYPGIELVAEAELSTTTDPYLSDHCIQGEYIVPGVIGLEAMAQAAWAVTECRDLPQFQDVKFLRPLVVPEHGTSRIRIAAFVHPDGIVEIAIRSAETLFQVDHFRACCTFRSNNAEPLECLTHLAHLRYEHGVAVALEPLRDLYGRILFHQGRFQRLQRYYSLHAYSCIAEIATKSAENWYVHYLPAQLILGDPAARDAVIHAIQACIPQAVLLPISVDQLIIVDTQQRKGEAEYVYARERAQQGDIFIYDVEVLDEQHNLLEQWQGLHLQKIQQQAPAQGWAEALLGPYIERTLMKDFAAADFRLVVHRQQEDRQVQSEEATTLLFVQEMASGNHVQIQHRPDGKPLIINEPALTLSLAHCGAITAALYARTSISVDIALIASHEYVYWQDLLGSERAALATLMARESGEDTRITFTRVWSAMECMKKAYGLLDTPLLLHSYAPDGWVIFRSGSYLIASYRAMLLSERHEALFSIAYQVK